MEIALFAVLAVVLLVIAGVAFKDGAGVGGSCITLLGIFFIICTVITSATYFGELREFHGKTFVVEAKVVDSAGKNVYLLYDLEENNNRVAKLDMYPPLGYQETTTTDGTILLTPIPGK